VLSKANIISIGGLLTAGLEDSTTFSQFFDDTIQEMGFFDTPIIYALGSITLATATATYNFPSACLKILNAINLSSGALLSLTTENGLEAYSKTWRTDTGDPIALTVDYLKNQVTVYPIPTATQNGNTVYILHTQERTSSFIECYAPFITAHMCAKEFGYRSHHQDVDFAENCRQFSDLAYALISGTIDE